MCVPVCVGCVGGCGWVWVVESGQINSLQVKTPFSERRVYDNCTNELSSNALQFMHELHNSHTHVI